MVEERKHPSSTVAEDEVVEVVETFAAEEDDGGTAAHVGTSLEPEVSIGHAKVTHRVEEPPSGEEH